MERTRSSTFTNFLRRGSKGAKEPSAEDDFVISAPSGPGIPVPSAHNKSSEGLAGMGELLGSIDDEVDVEEYAGAEEEGGEEEQAAEEEQAVCGAEEAEHGAGEQEALEEEEEEEQQQQQHQEPVDEQPAAVAAVAPAVKKDPLAARTSIAKEILSTEKTYVESLGLLKMVFETPLREALNSAKPLLAEEHLRCIFAHLDPILAYNSVLYEKLQKLIGVDTWDPKTTVLGPTFMELSFFLKTYSLYVNNFSNASELLEKQQRKNARFKEFLAQCKQDPRVLSKGIIDFLIMPVQRIPRYSLLLADLLRHTDEEHPDWKSLSDALARINEVALFINENKATQDDFVLISEIQAKLVETPWNLTLGKRKLIRKEDVELITYSEGQPEAEPCQLFFFSDCVFCAVKSRKKNLAVRKWMWLQEAMPVDASLSIVPDVSDACIKIIQDAELSRRRADERADDPLSSTNDGVAAGEEAGMVAFVVASLTAQGLMKRQVRVLSSTPVAMLIDEFAERAGGFDATTCKLLLKGEVMDRAKVLSEFNLAPTDVLHLVPETLSATPFPPLPTVSSPLASRIKLSIDTVKEVVKTNPHSRPSLAQVFSTTSTEQNLLFCAPNLDRDETEYLLKQIAERVVYCRAHPVSVTKMQAGKSDDAAQNPGAAAGAAAMPGSGSDADTDDAANSSFSASTFLSSMFGKMDRRNSASPLPQRRMSKSTLSPVDPDAADAMSPLRSRKTGRGGSSSDLGMAVSSSPPAVVEETLDTKAVLRAYASEKPVPKPPGAAAAAAAAVTSSSPGSPPPLPGPKPKLAPPPPPPPPKSRRSAPAVAAAPEVATADAPVDATPPPAATAPVVRAKAPPPPTKKRGDTLRSAADDVPPKPDGGDAVTVRPPRASAPAVAETEPVAESTPSLSASQARRAFETPIPSSPSQVKRPPMKKQPPDGSPSLSKRPSAVALAAAPKSAPGSPGPARAAKAPDSPSPAAKLQGDPAKKVASPALVRKSVGTAAPRAGAPTGPVGEAGSPALARKSVGVAGPRAGAPTGPAADAGSPALVRKSVGAAAAPRAAAPAGPTAEVGSPALVRKSVGGGGRPPVDGADETANTAETLKKGLAVFEGGAAATPAAAVPAPIQLPGEEGSATSVRQAALAKFKQAEAAPVKRGGVPPPPVKKLW